MLEPPKTRPDVKKAYIEEMKQLVQEQLGVTLKECGYPEDVSEYEGETQLGDFLNEVLKVTFVIFGDLVIFGHLLALFGHVWSLFRLPFFK